VLPVHLLFCLRKSAAGTSVIFALKSATGTFITLSVKGATRAGTPLSLKTLLFAQILTAYFANL